MAFEAIRKSTAVIAVSDGLGSAEYSGIGSEIAVRSASRMITDLFREKIGDTVLADITKNREIIENSFLHARESIQRYADENDIQTEQLACTLMVVLIDRNYVSCGHVGDGGIVGISGGEPIIISDPGYSEYINETTPITSDKWRSDLRIKENIPDIDSVSVFTDGCQRAVLTKPGGKYQPHIPFFNPFNRYINSITDPDEASEDLKNLLSSGMMAENSEDDKTFVVGVINRKTGQKAP
ncbi:PP2C family serine/threonine-protein phosphatase [Methanoplanus endosymbiosus]|uniref:Protein phosphatase 2C domain-containing protein n=1 Tax=Methanoplanus endosymbiosus TaxID=33865 RepID=A0A9E7TJT4_9EURY|nr:PP2C family serine/threonine-protein phosphatase [Methanoplanus endosymbiosus]UUX92055.1 protein phosphatase 2C domain-containing protein [Methanoplanus endosymbiosus]